MQLLSKVWHTAQMMSESVSETVLSVTFKAENSLWIPAPSLDDIQDTKKLNRNRR